MKIKAIEFERYLRWRVNVTATELQPQIEQIFKVFGTDPVFVDSQGILSSRDSMQYGGGDCGDDDED